MVQNLVKVGLLTALLAFPATTWSFEGPRGPNPNQICEGQFCKFPAAPGRHGRPGLGKWWDFPEVREKLGLSQEQVDSLSKLGVETETKLIEINAKLQIAKIKLREIGMKKDTPQENIDQLVNELGDLHKDQLKTFINQRRGTLNILNEDQVGKVEKFMAARKAHMRRGMDFMRRPFPPRDGEKGPGKDKEFDKDKGKKWDRDKDRDRDRDRDGDRDRKGDRDGMRGRRGDRDDNRPGPPHGMGPNRGRGFGMMMEGGPGMLPPPNGPMPPNENPALGGPVGPPPADAPEMQGPDAVEMDVVTENPEGPDFGMMEDPLGPFLLDGLPMLGDPIDEDMIADFE